MPSGPGIGFDDTLAPSDWPYSLSGSHRGAAADFGGITHKGFLDIMGAAGSRNTEYARINRKANGARSTNCRRRIFPSSCSRSRMVDWKTAWSISDTARNEHWVPIKGVRALPLRDSRVVRGRVDANRLVACHIPAVRIVVHMLARPFSVSRETVVGWRALMGLGDAED